MRRRKAEERRNTLIAFGLLSLIVLVSVGLLLKPGLIIPASDAAYGSSLGKTVSGGGGSCSDKPDSDWMVCRVETDPGSGAGGTMLLKKRSQGCWTAKWRKGAGKTVSGCVNVRDMIAPKEPGGSY